MVSHSFYNYHKIEIKAPFYELLGQTITKLELIDFDKELRFYCKDGSVFMLLHKTECCEDVRLEDICGELNTLLNSPIVMAEEVEGECGKNEDGNHFTYTFYKLATRKGYVTLRWCGTSNGYYSEKASLFHYPPQCRTSDGWLDDNFCLDWSELKEESKLILDNIRKEQLADCNPLLITAKPAQCFLSKDPTLHQVQFTLRLPDWAKSQLLPSYYLYSYPVKKAPGEEGFEKEIRYILLNFLSLECRAVRRDGGVELLKRLAESPWYLIKERDETRVYEMVAIN